MRRRARYSVRVPVTPAGSEPNVRSRANQTENQLTQWRSVATGRRRAYELSQWVAAEQARRRRRQWMQGLRGAMTTLFIFAVTVGVIAFQPGPSAEARSTETVTREYARPDLASGALVSNATMMVAGHSDALVELEAISEVPLVTWPTSDRVVTVAEAVDEIDRDFMGPQMPDAAEVVGVDHASVTQWTDDDNRWVSFQVGTDAPTWIRWRDPSGAYPIEAMPCAFPTEDAHQCRAGRTHWRMAMALSDGAPAGTWTIEACVGDVCEAVDTVEIGLD